MSYVLNEKILPLLLNWFEKNKEPLPWRIKNPYAIWISEIMLQQTRIATVLNKGYFAKFMQELPTIEDLAQVDENRLMKLWEGLGYYSRAKNLQKAAKIICEKFDGAMPKNFDELIQLPGIGKYTAAAIASIAFCEKEICIDGNVLRVIMRILNCQDDVLDDQTRKKVEQAIKTYWLEKIDDAGEFNQALMELGEKICLPKKPACENCPIKEFCLADAPETLPIRKNKTKRKIENRTIFLFWLEKKFALMKRNETGLLANLWQFPNVLDWIKEDEIEKTIEENFGVKAKEKIFLGKAKHIFSHITWQMIGWSVKVDEIADEQKNSSLVWICKEDLKNYSVPSAFKFYLQKIFEEE